MNEKLMTQAEIAREFSVSKALISRYVKTGELKPSGSNHTGKPLYSRDDAERVCGNAFLNNRKINRPDSTENSLNPDDFRSGKKVHEKVHSTEKVHEKSSREQNDVSELFIPSESDIDSWMNKLLGDDYDNLEDSKKIARNRAVREARLAALADLDVRKAHGELIEKEVVGQEATRIGAEITSIMHMWPARLSPEIAAITDQHQIKQLLINEVNTLIDHMEKRLKEL